MTEQETLRFERLALLIGTIMGQLSELLNKISNQQVNNTYMYHSLLDMQKMASLQLNEIYYKNNKPYQKKSLMMTKEEAYKEYPNLEEMEIKDIVKLFVAGSMAGDKHFADACLAIMKYDRDKNHVEN